MISKWIIIICIYFLISTSYTVKVYSLIEKSIRNSFQIYVRSHRCHKRKSRNKVLLKLVQHWFNFRLHIQLRIFYTQTIFFMIFERSDKKLNEFLSTYFEHSWNGWPYCEKIIDSMICPLHIMYIYLIQNICINFLKHLT